MWPILMTALLASSPPAGEPDLVLHGPARDTEMTLEKGDWLRIDLTRPSCDWELTELSGGLALVEQAGNVFDLEATRVGAASFTMLLHCGERTLTPQPWSVTVLSARQARGSGASIRATELIGNCSPTIEQPDRERRPGRPIAAQVHLFHGEVGVMEAPDPAHPALLEVLELDGTAPAELELEPGRYTALLVRDGAIIEDGIRSSGGVRSYRSFVVFPGRTTEVVVRDKRRAEY